MANFNGKNVATTFPAPLGYCICIIMCHSFLIIRYQPYTIQSKCDVPCHQAAS